MMGCASLSPHSTTSRLPTDLVARADDGLGLLAAQHHLGDLGRST
jgi:hypothetical protein